MSNEIIGKKDNEFKEYEFEEYETEKFEEDFEYDSEETDEFELNSDEEFVIESSNDEWANFYSEKNKDDEFEEITELLTSDEDLVSPEEYTFVPQDDLLSAMEGEVEAEEEYEEYELEEGPEQPEGATINPQEEPNKDTIHDASGQPVEFQTSGQMTIEEINLSDIFFPPRTRRNDSSDTDDLEALIIQWGLIEPLHVIPFNGKYLLIHGFRRYKALKNLNYETAICFVDSTRPKTTVRFLEVLCNNTKKFDFFEMMDFGEFIERKQTTFQTDTIEKILGMEPGDYLKAKYLRQFDNFGIINEVAMGRKTIKEGFKKLEKELVKAEKEKQDLMNVKFNEQGMPENPESYTEAIEEEANVQSTKDRKPLPPHVYARIKARDKYTCQTCGIGHNQPELNSIFETHHIKPVQMGGNDNDENLILICSNCHKVVGAYINGEFKPPVGGEDMYKNMILLGNIARKGLSDGKTAYQFYMENCDQPWVED